MPTPESTPPPTPVERRRPWALAWMLGWLLVIEGAARTLWAPEWVGGERYAAYDPSFGYGFDLVRPLCQPSDDHTMTCYPTQYRKFPEQSFDATKRADAVRMFTVGGSHAAGESSYTRELDKRLERRCPAIHWELVNLAVVAQGSRRILLAAEQAEQHQPDVLILDFGGSNEYEDERDFGYREQLHEGIWRYLLRSHAIVLGRKLLSKHFTFTNVTLSTDEDETLASKKPENLERWRSSIETNYRELISKARAQHLEVVIVGRASLEPHAPGSREEADYRLFQSLADEDVHLLDAHALFQEVERSKRAKLFRGDKNHYSRAGQQRIADALADLVLGQLRVGGPCQPTHD